MFQIERIKASIIGSLSQKIPGIGTKEEKVSRLSVFGNRKFDPYFPKEKIGEI